MKIRVQAILLALSVSCFCGGNVYAVGPETKPNTFIILERPWIPIFPIDDNVPDTLSSQATLVIMGQK